MNLFDTVNGMFELGGALCSSLNVVRLWRDRKVAGVHWGPTLLFTFFGVWNLLYYPHLHQWVSFTGGVTIVLVNITWLVSAWRFGAFDHSKMENVVE